MIFAGVMELADVLDSKSSGSDTVPVRPRSPAPNFHTYILSGCSAVGDVSERRQWRMQRGKRSGATRSIAKWITSETTMLQQEARRTSRKNLINAISGCSAVGSAPALGAGCREFEPLHSDHFSTTVLIQNCCTFCFYSKKTPQRDSLWCKCL